MKLTNLILESQFGYVEAGAGENKDVAKLLDDRKAAGKDATRKCEMCGQTHWVVDMYGRKEKKPIPLEVHHKEGRKISDADGLDNLMLVCPNCHRFTSNWAIPDDKEAQANLKKLAKWLARPNSEIISRTKDGKPKVQHDSDKDEYYVGISLAHVYQTATGAKTGSSGTAMNALSKVGVDTFRWPLSNQPDDDASWKKLEAAVNAIEKEIREKASKFSA